jgi:hypothetical protein
MLVGQRDRRSAMVVPVKSVLGLESMGAGGQLVTGHHATTGPMRPVTMRDRCAAVSACLHLNRHRAALNGIIWVLPGARPHSHE